MGRYKDGEFKIAQHLDLSHGRFGWVDLDATSNPDPGGGSNTVGGNPARYVYLRALGADATVINTNLMDPGTPAEKTSTFYDGFPEPGLWADDVLKITAGTVRAYYADPYYYDI